MPNSFSVQVNSESETIKLGRRFAEIVHKPLTVSLSGTLGAGKTRFVKGIAAGMGIDSESVVSPTFSIANQYQGRMLIHHLDVYRIVDSDEFLELGVDELFESNALVIIEWGERFQECLPDEYLEIRIDTVEDDENARDIAFSIHGKTPEGLANELSILCS